MTLDGTDAPGATPLTDDDLLGLIPSDVATRGDLNQVEADNIAEARAWAGTRRWTPDGLLRAEVLHALHRRMYGRVWRWAGTQRRRETVGVAPETIAVALRTLLDDVAAWVAYGTYDADDAALRFHHRLVLIHVYPNGNGRHARLCADLLARASGRPPFSWGGRDLIDGSEARQRYLAALRALDADRDDVAPLMAFARG